RRQCSRRRLSNLSPGARICTAVLAQPGLWIHGAGDHPGGTDRARSASAALAHADLGGGKVRLVVHLLVVLPVLAAGVPLSPERVGRGPDRPDGPRLLSLAGHGGEGGAAPRAAKGPGADAAAFGHRRHRAGGPRARYSGAAGGLGVALLRGT